MKRLRRGFTLIEVSLFLAVSAALFVGVTIGVQTSIKQQRYNDSVQNYTEFLRTVYSNVLSVQHAGNNKGRSERAIYGKLIVFGEEKDFSGAQNSKKLVFSYDIVAKADAEGGSTDALSQLKMMDARVVTDERDSYLLKWGAQLQTGDYKDFKGSIMIVRHPTSGIVYTYYTKKVLEINSDANVMKTFLTDATFTASAVDFCINPEPGQTNLLRRDVRIVQNARNASGIVIVPDNGEDNKCN